MDNNILVTASALSDQDLLTRLATLAGEERTASVELVAHLAALDSRQMLYAAQGYGSLFSYCTRALRLSEDAACNRIDAARACRRFPLILELLASGSLSLTSVRLLAPHLTAENHESVLAKAGDRTRREVEGLVAELAPRPDLPSTVRKVPCFMKTLAPSSGPGPSASAGPGLAHSGHGPGHSSGPGPAPSAGHGSAPPSGLAVAQWSGPGAAMADLPSETGIALDASHFALPATPRPIVQASAPDRYRVQFTIGQETHEKLRQLQTLLRREIPNGDPGVLFDRALTVLLEKVEKTKLGAAARPRSGRPIRPGTDRSGSPSSSTREACNPASNSRHVPREVQRVVWERDAGQCAFVSTTERRCAERTFLEFHHIQPYAQQGPATVGNISLRCRRHNQYEAELIFGPRGPSIVCEVRPPLGVARSEPGRPIDSSAC